MRVTPSSGDFYRLEKIPASATKWIKYDLPTEYRYYDKKDDEDIGYWYVHRNYLINVIELAYKSSGHVDYSALQPYLQMEIATEKENWTVNRQTTKNSQAPTPSMVLRDAYTTLHILPSIPTSAVSAVWHSLAKISHPDQGGDAEAFRKYSDAYDLIKKERK